MFTTEILVVLIASVLSVISYGFTILAVMLPPQSNAMKAVRMGVGVSTNTHSFFARMITSTVAYTTAAIIAHYSGWHMLSAFFIINIFIGGFMTILWRHKTKNDPAVVDILKILKG